MILSPHIVVGAVIGAKTQNLGLIILLGLLLHVIMDWIPHYDYKVLEYIKKFKKTKKLKSIFPFLIKLSLDSMSGFLIVIILVLYKDIFYLWPFILFGIFFSVFPDIILGFLLFFSSKKISKKYFAFHKKYLHFSRKKEEGKITFLNVSTQVIVIIVSVFLIYL